jgi:hypothetical protein
MKTQCRTTGPKQQGQISLDLGLGKPIEGNFDGGQISSDGGLLLLRKADEELSLTELAAHCFGDKRRQDLVRYPVLNLLRQRIYAIAAGYEDCNDAARLRHDPMHMLASASLRLQNLASQPSLSRWENSADDVTLKLLQESLVLAYIRHLRRKKRKPKVIRISIDTSVDPTYGQQQLSIFNGFYRTSCYVPLFGFTEDGFPLVALLRPGNANTYEGAVRTLRKVVTSLRTEWPSVRVELTADAGFGVPEVYNFCDQYRIDYLICMKGNDALGNKSAHCVEATKRIFEEKTGRRLELDLYGKLTKAEKQRICRQHQEKMRFASKTEGRQQELFEDESSFYVRKFCEFEYAARPWTHERRIIARVDYSNDGPEVRYVVTNIKRGNPQDLYERYCKRSQCENWIKDLKTYLKCDRTSCQEFNANQLRLLLHTYAYILLWNIRNKAGMGYTTVISTQIQLLKIGVLVKKTARRIWLKFASNHPWQEEFIRAWNTA